MLGLFVNTLTGEYTYSGRNMQTLTQQVQTPLSLKQKTSSGFFIAFLKSTWNGEHFQKKESFLAKVFSKLLTPKEVVTEVPEKPYFRTAFRNQAVNE